MTADAVAALSSLLFLVLWPRAVCHALAVQGCRAPEPARAPAHVTQRSASDAGAEAQERTRTVAGRGAGGRRGVLLLDGHGDLAAAEHAARRHVPWAARERLWTAPPPPAADTAALLRALQDARVAVLATSDPAQTEAALDRCAAAGVPLLLPRRGAVPRSSSPAPRA